MIYDKTTMKQTTKKLRNNDKTLRIQRNSSRSTGVQKERAKTMDQQGVVGVSRREKMTEEQHRADKVRKD